jgi:hypothetical protein
MPCQSVGPPPAALVILAPITAVILKARVEDATPTTPVVLKVREEVVSPTVASSSVLLQGLRNLHLHLHYSMDCGLW